MNDELRREPESGSFKPHVCACGHKVPKKGIVISMEERYQAKYYIFDLGRVLFRFYEDELAAPYVAAEDIALVASVMFGRDLWDPLDAGNITDERLKEIACSRLPERLRAPACAAYDHWPENLTEVPGMRALVSDLRAAGHGLYVLSNISAAFAARWQDVPRLRDTLSLFDGRVFSGAIHMVKPGAEIFRYLTDTFGLDPADCVFIDDNPRNVAAGERLGIRGYLFDGDADRLRRTILDK